MYFYFQESNLDEEKQMKYCQIQSLGFPKFLVSNVLAPGFSLLLSYSSVPVNKVDVLDYIRFY